MERVRGSIRAEGKSATVGTFLELLVTGPGQLIGSGHPDQPKALPGFLGFIRSDDGVATGGCSPGSARLTCTRS